MVCRNITGAIFDPLWIIRVPHVLGICSGEFRSTMSFQASFSILGIGCIYIVLRRHVVYGYPYAYLAYCSRGSVCL